MSDPESLPPSGTKVKSNRPKKSGVWKYYDIDEADDSRAVCKLCLPTFVSISRGSKIKGPQSYGTSALWAHLKLTHKPEYASLEKCPSYPKFKQIKRPSNKILKNIKLTDFGQPDTSKGPSLLDTCIVEPNLKLTAENNQNLITIGEMIILDNQPITIVEEKGFQKLTKSIIADNDLLKSKYFCEYILPQIHFKLKNKIQLSLNEVEWFSLSIDIDQTSFQNETLIIITIYFINMDYEHKHFVLSTNIFPTYPSAKILEALIEDTLNSWSIDKSQIHLVIHGHSNLSSDPETILRELRNETYLAKLIQIAVEESLFSQPIVTRVLDLCRNYICYLAETRETTDLMNMLCNVPIMNDSDSDLVLDSHSEWKSTHDMLINVKKQKDHINKLTAINHALTISPNDWSVIEEIIRVFNPLRDILVHSVQCNSISNVIPYLAIALKYYNNNPSVSETDIKDIMREGIYKQFYIDYKLEERRNLVLATLLDPRYKQKFFSEENKESIKGWLIEELQTVNEEESYPYNRIKIESNNINLDIWQCFDEIASGRESTNHLRTNSHNMKEVDQYLKTPLLPRSYSPLIWWKNYENIYPQMSKLARKYLSAPIDSFFAHNKQENLLIRLKGSVDEDSKKGLIIDLSHRLFMHLNLPAIRLES